jgi:rhomboid family GlyGly-CTERM serine protease
MIVSLVALLAYVFPTMSQWLQLDFDAVARGQWWRIWTGHLTHYDGGHLFWDLLMFATLGAVCERRHPSLFLPAILLIVAVISVSIGLFCDGITLYRGLSGLDTGLFVWFVGDQCRECSFRGERVFAMLWLMPVVGLIGKLIFEATTGQTLFVDSTAFTPLVESHIAGATIGLMCSRTQFRDDSSSRPIDPQTSSSQIVSCDVGLRIDQEHEHCVAERERGNRRGCPRKGVPSATT